MEAIFDSLGYCIYNENGHKAYTIKWKLIAPLCKKWSRNRDPDMARVNEMFDYFVKNGYIPKMIHLAEIDGEGLVCYDGNHRKEVFNRCNDDSLTCIVDVMFHASQNDVYKAFNNINKSVQLPAIYIEENENINVKLQIIDLVKSYEASYKALLSTSPRCHAPNFNRDLFTDNIYNIYQNFHGLIDIDAIGKLLVFLNNEYANGRLCRPHSSYKQSLIQKCKKYNMWLFIEKTIPFEHLNVLLQNGNK